MSGAQRLKFYGPTLIVDIGFDMNLPPGATPTLAGKDMGALVDTGASMSCIDRGLAMQLNLPVVNRQSIAGVQGKGEVNMHLGHIFVPSLKVLMTGQFAAVDLRGGGQPHLALIGRDFLSRFKMSYDGRTGEVEIGD
jgi:predicted aspartyl protease